MRWLYRHGLLWLLLAAGLLTRVVGLDFPGEVVFDEVHFGKFVTSYCCSGERFFDIHPPHGKLIVAGAAYIGGYNGEFSFDHIGQLYGSAPVAALRIAPALAGVLIPVLVYLLLLQAGVSRSGAFLGGLIFVFDNAFVVQSRIISLDNMLIAAVLGCLSVYLAAWRRGGWLRYVLCAVSGCLAGFAVGVKFTGLAALGVVGVLMLFRVFRAKTSRQFTSLVLCGLTILAMACVVYVGGWAFHFALLSEPGSGDAWGVPTGHFVTDFVDVHKKMLDANYNLEQGHTYSSMWWSWPMMNRPVFYWQNDGRSIYFLGNPVVWWGSFILGAVALVFSVMSLWFRDARVRSGGWVFLVGYCIAYIPLMRVPRALFLYHYMVPLVFFLLFGLQWLDYVLRNRNRRVWYCSMAVAVVVMFVFFSPLAYGLRTPSWQALLFWFSSWR